MLSSAHHVLYSRRPHWWWGSPRWTGSTYCKLWLVDEDLVACYMNVRSCDTPDNVLMLSVVQRHLWRYSPTCFVSVVTEVRARWRRPVRTVICMFVSLVSIRPSVRVCNVGSQLTGGNGTTINCKIVLTEFHSKGKRLGTNTGAVSLLWLEKWMRPFVYESDCCGGEYHIAGFMASKCLMFWESM